MVRSPFSRVLQIALALLLVTAGFVPGVSAQESQRWTKLAVSIWPEYDQPSVFVNYEGQLADSVKLPATVRLALPKGIQVSSACEIDAAGQHTVVTHTETTGDNPGVSYPTGKKDTHIEFYFNPISGAGKRELTYTFVSPGAVDNLVIDVQQPLRSTGFTMNPASKQVLSDKEGFKYHRFEYSNVTEGQAITFNIGYEKADAKPSVDPQQATSAAAAPSGGAGSEYALPLVLMGLGLVGLAVYFFTRTRQRPQRRMAYAGGTGSRGRGAAAPRSASQAAASSGSQANAGFCTKCGARLRAGAAFCPSCGQPVRRRP